MADDIIVRVRAEGVDEFKRKIKEAGGVVEDTGDKVEDTNKKMSSSFSKLGKVIGGAFVATAVIQFGKEMTKLAIQLDATNAKFKTVFGDAGKIVEDFAKTSANSLGLTISEYKKAAASAGDLLVPLGIQRKEAAKMSAELVNLSGALSAWTGGQQSATQVSEILTKALLGEREQLKTLGINILEADVQTRLLEKGQKKLTGTALAQAKALATLELITEKSADAQAAFGDDTVTLAEAQLEFSAGVKELRDRLATSLIPAITDVINALNNGLRAYNNFADRITGRAARSDFEESLEQLDMYGLKVERLTLQLKLNALEEQGGFGSSEFISKTRDRIAIIDEEIASRSRMTEEVITATEENDDYVSSLTKAANKMIELTALEDTRIQALKKLQEELKQQQEFQDKLLEDSELSISDTTQAAIDGQREETEARKKEFQKRKDDAVAAEKEEADARLQAIQEAEQKRQEIVSGSVNAIRDIQATAFDFVQQAIQNELTALELRYDKGLIGEKEFQEQRAELLTKQAKADKANAIFSSVIGTAAAIVQALNAPPPASFVFAGIAGAIGLAQQIAIAAQPIPAFAEGTKDAPKGFAWVGERGPELVQMRGGEKVITAEDSTELMKILGGYGIPVQFDTTYDQLYKPMTAISKLVSDGKDGGIDWNPLLNSNDINRRSAGKKLDKIYQVLDKMHRGGNHRMTRA